MFFFSGRTRLSRFCVCPWAARVVRFVGDAKWCLTSGPVSVCLERPCERFTGPIKGALLTRQMHPVCTQTVWPVSNAHPDRPMDLRSLNSIVVGTWTWDHVPVNYYYYYYCYYYFFFFYFCHCRHHHHNHNHNHNPQPQPTTHNHDDDAGDDDYTNTGGGIGGQPANGCKDRTFWSASSLVDSCRRRSWSCQPRR